MGQKALHGIFLEIAIFFVLLLMQTCFVLIVTDLSDHHIPIYYIYVKGFLRRFTFVSHLGNC